MKATLLAGLLGLISGSVAAFCPNSASTEYEKVYCQIQKESPETRLPSEQDFQGNDVTIQYLLLKRHAERLEIELHKPASLNKPKPKPKQQMPASGSSYYDMPAVASIPNPFSSLTSNCQRSRLQIRCGEFVYRLQRGHSVAQLAPNALSEHNQLLMPRYQGQSAAMYLNQVYPLYLEKMLSLGLEGKTMNYTKFADTFTGYQRQSVDFAARFKDMFTFLKQDRKKSQGNPGGAVPKQIETANCYKVSQALLVCDEMDKNYLFTLQE